MVCKVSENRFKLCEVSENRVRREIAACLVSKLRGIFMRSSSVASTQRMHTSHIHLASACMGDTFFDCLDHLKLRWVVLLLELNKQQGTRHVGTAADHGIQQARTVGEHRLRRTTG